MTKYSLPIYWQMLSIQALEIKITEYYILMLKINFMYISSSCLTGPLFSQCHFATTARKACKCNMTPTVLVHDFNKETSKVYIVAMYVY